MTWIRAGVARIHGTGDRVARLEAQAGESFTGIGLQRFSVDTRQRKRVSTKIARLSRDFVIAFARIQIAATVRNPC